MRTNNDSKKNQLLNHQKNMKRLRDKNSLEIEKVQLKHESRKNELKMSQGFEKNNLRADHSIAMMEQARKNEAAFESMQKSLNDVKTRTRNEKEKITQDHGDKLEELRVDFRNKASSKKEKSQYLMQDIDHEASVHIQKLNRRIRQKEHELKQVGKEDISDLKVKNEKTKEVTRHDYNKKQMAQTFKYQKSLLDQKHTQTNTLATNERKHHRSLESKNKLFAKESSKILNDFRSKKALLHKRHQKEYKKNYKTNEFVLQQLVGKKEKILTHLKSNLKKAYAKEMVLEKDPFYQHTSLNPVVTENDTKDGYKITIKIPKHEAKSVTLTGYDRELKISMDRNFDFTKIGKKGAKEVIKRVETVTTRIPVEKILNSKTISKTFVDNTLEFHIKYA